MQDASCVHMHIQPQCYHCRRPQDKAPHPPCSCSHLTSENLACAQRTYPGLPYPSVSPLALEQALQFSQSRCKSQKKKSDFMWPKMGMWVNLSVAEIEFGSIFFQPPSAVSLYALCLVLVGPTGVWEVPWRTLKNGAGTSSLLHVPHAWLCAWHRIDAQRICLRPSCCFAH